MSEVFDLFNGFGLLAIPLFAFALPVASLVLAPVVAAAIVVVVAAVLLALPVLAVRRVVTP